MRQLIITRQINNTNSTALDIYLREVSKIKLLTPEKEVELAQRISEGDQQALEELVKANLRFVISVANQYQNRGLSLPDLINEGNLGLITAAERFDKSRGFKFISYAVWWIRRSILQALAENSRIVRLPQHKIGLKNKIAKAHNQLSHELLREPTIEELSSFLNLQTETVEIAINYLNIQLSLDAPISNEDETNLYDLMLNADSPSPERQLNKDSIRKEIERSLAVLCERDSEIVRSFFGFDGNTPLSLTEIALSYGLTHERVRQIKDGALKKLKTQHHSKHVLKEYICA